MLHTTSAIVLKTIRHGDHTVVLKVWTERFGKRSYVVRTGKRGAPASALQPLSRIELVVDEHPERDLHAAREVRLERPYIRVPFDPVRGALALFVQEVLYRVLREEVPDPALNDFIARSLETIDTAEDIRHFPLVFLLLLSGHMGFFPEPPSAGEEHFDLQEGHFLPQAHPHGHALGPPLSHAFIRLLNADLDNMQELNIPGPQRRDLLDHLLLYFRLHLEGLGEMRSPVVLHETIG